MKKTILTLAFIAAASFVFAADDKKADKAAACDKPCCEKAEKACCKDKKAADKGEKPCCDKDGKKAPEAKK